MEQKQRFALQRVARDKQSLNLKGYTQDYSFSFFWLSSILVVPNVVYYIVLPLHCYKIWH